MSNKSSVVRKCRRKSSFFFTLERILNRIRLGEYFHIFVRLEKHNYHRLKWKICIHISGSVGFGNFFCQVLFRKG